MGVVSCHQIAAEPGSRNDGHAILLGILPHKQGEGSRPLRTCLGR